MFEAGKVVLRHTMLRNIGNKVLSVDEQRFHILFEDCVSHVVALRAVRDAAHLSHLLLSLRPELAML